MLAADGSKRKRERERVYMDESLTAKVVNVTPQYARHLRDTSQFSRQRAIAELNVQRLAVEITHGRFIPGTTVYLAVLPDETMLILNGNHTLEAVCASGRAQWLVLIFKRVADEAEAARLYGSFDIHKARTWTDALKAIGADKKIALSQSVMPAVGHIMQSFIYDPRNVEANSSREARFESMKPYTEAANILQGALVGAPGVNKQAVRRKGVMAVALETLRYQPGHATVFWKDLAHDDGLANGDPRKTLLRWLLNPSAGGGLTGASAANVLSRGAIAAWNAWYRGDALQHLRPIAGPIVILGTPRSEPRKGSAKPKDPDPEVSAGDPSDPAAGKLGDLFETGVKPTRDGNEPVVLYRKAREG